MDLVAQTPSPAVPSFVYPASFRGIYRELLERHADAFEEAMATLRTLPISPDLRPSWAYQTWENPQPSFILLPITYVGAAEASGGMTRKHRDFLPAVLLLAELLAVADDTVDRCKRRSDRDTYAHRFGDASALPFSNALTTIMLQLSYRVGPWLFEAASSYWARFFPLELWEREHAFPASDLFPSWLEHRYNQTVWTNQFLCDAALRMNGQPAWPPAAIAALGRIAQDVDDIVNLAEYREDAGENDDLMCGMVTRPLVHAIRACPGLDERINGLWDLHRPLSRENLSIAAFHDARGPLIARTRDAYVPIRKLLLQHGVPATLVDCRADLALGLRETPEPLRPMFRGLATGFLDRLEKCHIVDLAQ